MGVTPSHSSRVEDKRLRNLGGANESHAEEANGTLAQAALEVVNKPLHHGGSAVAKAANRRGHTGAKAMRSASQRAEDWPAARLSAEIAAWANCKVNGSNTASYMRT